MKKTIGLILIAFAFISYLQGQNFTSSSLPIVVINTNGNTIEDDPKVAVDIGIIDNGPGNLNYLTDPFNAYNGHCGIEFRGNSTQGFDKKTYSIELWTSAGLDTSASILGLPKEEDWILHANHVDKTFLRNTLSYHIWGKIGYWSSNTIYVELVLDGDYRGLYTLMEKNKRDNNRVDIAKLDSDDNLGDSLTGGYIIRMDWPEGDGFYSNYNSQDGSPLYFQYYYPKATKITNQQKAYIQSYLQIFENSLYSSNLQNLSTHYLNYIDLTTFADLFIINELSRSVDAYKLSSYIYKDRIDNGGKLKAGPIWDFDLAYDNAAYCGGESETGWTYLQAENSCDDLMLMPMWWQTFMSDPIFTNHLKCRWESLKQSIFNVNYLHNFIDSTVLTINNAQARNFQRWPVLGVDLFAQPWPLPANYTEEVDVLKTWLSNRINWIDNNIPGDCSADIVSNHGHLINTPSFTIYPNPIKDQFIISFEKATINQVQLIDVSGKITIDKKVTDSNQLSISTFDLNSGIYLIRIFINNGIINSKIIIE